MKCVICHGEEIEYRDVQEKVRVGSDIVYVPVHVPVCQTCGERYYERKTMRHLEAMEMLVKEGEPGLTEVGRVLVYE